MIVKFELIVLHLQKSNLKETIEVTGILNLSSNKTNDILYNRGEKIGSEREEILGLVQQPFKHTL